MDTAFQGYLKFILGVTLLFTVLPFIPSNNYGYAGNAILTPF